MAAFQMNEPGVVAETIDGEAIVINLDRGIYYSIKGIGLAVWTDLIEGSDPQNIADRLRGCEGAETADVFQDVASFVERLVDENLIRPRAAGSGVQPGFAIGSMSYARPLLEKYTDMEALLLLDPVHDVDDSGWPTRA